MMSVKLPQSPAGLGMEAFDAKAKGGAFESEPELPVGEGDDFDVGAESTAEFGAGDSGKSRRRSDAKAPVAKASWQQTAAVMIADVVGVGVLMLASAIAKLGWIPGLIMLVGFFPLNAYTGILLSRTRQLLPKSVTMGDMARYTYGMWFMYIVGGYVYANMFFILGDYLIVTGQSLGMIFYDVHICKPVWMAIAAVCILPLMQFSRTLHNASFLCWFNMASITISVMIAVVYMIIEGREAMIGDSYTELVASNLTIQSFFGAMSSFVFAYSGQFMYLELMSEMKNPSQFPKAFFIAGPYQLFMYSMVACVGYHYKGVAVSGFIINNIPFGIAYRVSAVFLFLHMLVTYVIKGQVLSRAIHLIVHPSSANDFGKTGRLVWLAISTVLLAVGWIMATAIPFFDVFSACLGAFQALPTLIFPAMFFQAARKAASMPVHKGEVAVLIVFCYLLGLCLLVFGVWDAVDNAIASFASLGGPFSCQCHDIWATGCPAVE